MHANSNNNTTVRIEFLEYHLILKKIIVTHIHLNVSSLHFSTLVIKFSTTVQSHNYILPQNYKPVFF